MSQTQLKPSIKTLMKEYGTDKGYLHGYDVAYELHFEPIRNNRLRLLEIGIGGYQYEYTGGESLRMWAEYFQNGDISGIDVFDKSHVDTNRITTFKGAQQDVSFLETVETLAGPFDIVIDDGSHIQTAIDVSFRTLFPLLNPNGFYVIEDLSLAYAPKFDGDYFPFRRLGSKQNAMSIIMELIDGLHCDAWIGRTPSSIQLMVHSVHVVRDIVFIRKKGTDG